jgi:hypothetical protein
MLSCITYIKPFQGYGLIGRVGIGCAVTSLAGTIVEGYTYEIQNIKESVSIRTF